jgi:hypothetical protein
MVAEGLFSEMDQDTLWYSDEKRPVLGAVKLKP